VRVSFQGLTATPPVVYLTADASEDGIAGFLVGTDPQASSGVVVSRTIDSPSYSPSNVAGIYAASTAEDLDGLTPVFLGAISFDGTGWFTVTPQLKRALPNHPQLGTINVNSDGSGNLDERKFTFVTNGAALYAIPNSGDAFLLVLDEETPLHR
jgi:hypothetical protein